MFVHFQDYKKLQNTGNLEMQWERCCISIVMFILTAASKP